ERWPRGNQLWVARYNMPGNGGDYATAIAVDGQGNTYVTGYSYGQGTGYDYATVKYDYNGNQLWVARYNGPGSGEDRANALKLDGQGNVYVTGTSWSVDSNTDYATVKYDTNGNQLWVARYDGPRFSSDVATALSMDGQANVYVTGYSRGVDSGMDYSTVKYDTNGNRLWVARYNGTGNGDDYARALAVDSQSNVYVTGESWGGSTYNDFGTVKYDANGDQLWVNRYNGPRDSRDYARAVAVDGQGNIYVTGDSEGSGTYSDYLTCKYDANGNQLWAARYDGSASRYDAAKALALDGQGNVYVTGSSAAANGRTGYTTVKYDANGNQLWVARYEGPGGYDFANGLVVDDQGNVYVTGSSQGAWNATPRTLSDYATVKYDPNGDQLWVARYNGPGNGNDYAQALAIDGQRNIYVTGQSWGGNDTKNDYATLKYDSTGNQLWVARYNGPGNGDDIAAGLAADSQGNVYVSGQSWGGNDTKNDYATVKYDSSGNQLWLARYNGSGNGDDVAKALAVDGQGNVYVTGQSWGGTDTKNDYATVKYDSNGNQLWLARYNAPGNWYDQANALVLDAQGNVYVTGSSWGDGYNYATLKYDSNGNQQWVVRYIGPGKSDWATALTVDGQGNVYVTGFSMGATTGFDYTTIKYMQTQALKESSFQVQNLSPTNTATVNIKYYNSDGSAAASETAFVSPSSSLLRDSRGGPNPMPSYLSVNFNGSVEVISDQPIVSSMNVFQGDSADGYNGVAQAEASRNILLPLIYGYGNRNLWHTRFTVQNPSDTAASITKWPTRTAPPDR
ncbi:MAG: NHL repeat-containing protein, partial [Chloroflexi bacterium]|nr:NHL repeat-containing protein [Chloroflexota bacterium]